jgi:hypothetical protein
MKSSKRQRDDLRWCVVDVLARRALGMGVVMIALMSQSRLTMVVVSSGEGRVAAGALVMEDESVPQIQRESPRCS